MTVVVAGRRSPVAGRQWWLAAGGGGIEGERGESP